ncbi:hypothetical protein GX48_03430 [Paracoccidioides brasiliensis]|nr:hypothetical protein GX48_03430 [Paracoccidioides brasiliensis]
MILGVATTLGVGDKPSLSNSFLHSARTSQLTLKAILIGSANLRFDESPSYSIKYCAEGEDEPPAYARTYYVRVDPSGTLQLGELVDRLFLYQCKLNIQWKRGRPPETAVKILAIRPVLGLATVCDGDKMDQVPRMLRTSTGSREVNFYKQIPIFQSSISEAGSTRYISFLIPAQTQQMIRFAVRKVFTECEVNTLKGVTDYRRRSSWEVYSGEFGLKLHTQK